MGRDLTLQSEQDSDRYDAKQQNASAGGSFTLGSMTGSGYISASQDKLHSNFDSVKEQTGLFAGEGGYDITVGKHTQLDGAVISSTADKAKNSLDTGTLGWNDIDNQADFSAKHSGGSLSTGGPVGKELLTNMSGWMLSGASNSGHAEGTTQAAVSDGQLTIRDKTGQQQDIAELNRDVEHANDGSISPIFNKEKEQKRLKEAQLIGELGMQAMDVARTQGEIAALEAQKDPAKLSEARAELVSKGKPFTDADVAKQAYNNAQAEWGTGSNVQKAMQAVTGALTALAGNNLSGALASGASPYLATEIKKLTTGPDGQVNTAANTIAHAVLGAITAELNNQSALAGGVGAGGGELAARVITDKLFPGKKPSELTESEKQQVSALSQLAAGIAGGMAAGNAEGAVTAGQAGKNAVENNALGCSGSSDPLCVGKPNDELLMGGGGRGGKAKPSQPSTTPNKGSSQAETKPSSGAENTATYPKLKDDLVQQNLNNIAKQDPRLADVVKGSGTVNPNFSAGMGTAAEAERLGKIWVGDGARLLTDGKGWVSADGTRVYRFPASKPNTPEDLNPTGIQANFETLKDGKRISNGHMGITQ